MADDSKNKPLLRLVDYRNGIIAQIKANKSNIIELEEQLDIQLEDLQDNERELIYFNAAIEHLERM